MALQRITFGTLFALLLIPMLKLGNKMAGEKVNKDSGDKGGNNANNDAGKSVEKTDKSDKSGK